MSNSHDYYGERLRDVHPRPMFPDAALKCKCGGTLKTLTDVQLHNCTPEITTRSQWADLEIALQQMSERSLL